MTTTGKPQELLSATRIAERLQVLGEEINQHYQGKEILLISILDGAIVFTADLLRQLACPLNWIACEFPAMEIPLQQSLPPSFGAA